MNNLRNPEFQGRRFPFTSVFRLAQVHGSAAVQGPALALLFSISVRWSGGGHILSGPMKNTQLEYLFIKCETLGPPTTQYVTTERKKLE